MKDTLTPQKASRKGQQVDTRHTDELIRNYKKNRWIQNSEKIGKPDSLSVWYGMKELEGFLQLAKENQADGIKMYFGVYPDDFAPVPEFQGRQTMVLVATKQKESAGRIVNKNIYVNKDGNPEILAFNLGQACPPFCGTGLPPDGDGPYGIDMETIGISIISQDDKTIII